MKSWIVVVAAALVSVATLSVGAFVDETPDTEGIMKALFKKGSGKFSTALDKQVKASPTDWEAIQTTTGEIAKLGGDLAKGEPQKGDKESFKKLATKFGENTKALHTAAEAKDLAKLQATQKAIGASCKSCHTAHRGK